MCEGLYSSRLATCAAIRGACPAGGCCIALCCDARFITPNGTMGLNEVGGRGSVPGVSGLFMACLHARTLKPSSHDRLWLSL